MTTKAPLLAVRISDKHLQAIRGYAVQQHGRTLRDIMEEALDQYLTSKNAQPFTTPVQLPRGPRPRPLLGDDDFVIVDDDAELLVAST